VVNANLVSMWAIQVRNSDIAVTMMGIPGGFAHFWREILGFLDSPCRKFTDEARLIEKSETCAGSPDPPQA